MVDKQTEPPHHEMHLMDDLASMATLATFYPETDSLLSEWPSSLMRKIYRSVTYLPFNLSASPCLLKTLGKCTFIERWDK